MSYDELNAYGVLRKVHRCGPVSMFRRLLHEWVPGRALSPTAVAEKVKRFFFFYSANRHKARRSATLSAAQRGSLSPRALSLQ